MPDTNSTLSTLVASGKRTRSKYEDGDGEAQLSVNGSGDVEGLCWFYVSKRLTNCLNRLLI